MKQPSPRTLPPASTDELLRTLRAARLLSGGRVAAAARRWARRPCGCQEGVRELVAAGLLTQYQAEQVLAGRAWRLRLGPYRVLERLGVGGMGQVYKAEHILMRRVVALKVVARLPRPGTGTPPPGAPSRRELVARFRREVRALGRLSHPNVVTAYDAGAVRGYLFLVMEYVEGTDLGRYVARHGPLPVPLACEAVRQAALALQYARDRGLVHRDIKPDNLLLAGPGVGAPEGVGSLPSLPDAGLGDGGALVKLLDLGLALPARLRPGRAEPAGTPDYMAPEQAHARGPVDVRSDLYSLGCTFYHLLTGRVPYPGGSWTEKLLRHGIELPRAVSALRPDVPPAVAAVVERLMAKEPDERYPGPAAVAAVLRELAERDWDLGPRPVEARPVSPSSHVRAPASLADGRGGPVSEVPSTPSLPVLPGAPPAAGESPSTPGAEPILSTGVAGAERTATPRSGAQAPGVDETAAATPAESAALTHRRGRFPSPGAMLFAVLAGAVLALALRELPLPAPPPAGPGPAALPPRQPFHVERLGREFATLAEAVAAAADGDTVSVSGAGPHRLPPTDFGSKALTLRAAGGERPRLEPHAPAADGPWQALLSAERSLTLEGLDLATSGDAPLVAAVAGPLCLTDCRLTATGRGPAVLARGGGLCLRRCRVRAEVAAVAVAADTPCAAELAGDTVTVGDPAGVAVAVWAPEDSAPVAVRLRLQGNAVDAARVVAFRAPAGPVRVEASANEFTFREALASFSGYAGWRRWAAWEGGDNRCHAGGPWLVVDGGALPVGGADTWRQLWDPPASVPK